MSTTSRFLLLSVRYFRSTSSNHFQLTITWVAILLYDYCLTFGTEVERCWGVGQLNWASGFFYLNRYLVLFGHVPIMLEYFWSTSNPNKTEVSILFPKTPVLVSGGKILMRSLSDVGIHAPLTLDTVGSNDIFCSVVTTCNRFTNTWPS